MNKKKESFVLYQGYEDQLQDLTDEQLGKLLRYIFKYERTQIPEDIKDSYIKIAFQFIRKNLDTNRIKYDEICQKRSVTGSKGAEERWNKYIASDSKYSNCQQVIASVADNDNDTEYDNGTDNGNGIDIVPAIKVPSIKSNSFSIPSLEEVSTYCQERGKGVDAEEWIAHYESNGWKVGSNAMKDWKGAVRTWEKKRFDKPAYNKPTPNILKPIPDYSEGESTAERWAREDKEKAERAKETAK